MHFRSVRISSKSKNISNLSHIAPGVFELLEGRHAIFHDSSQNGTSVNGQLFCKNPGQPSISIQLRHGDLLIFGGPGKPTRPNHAEFRLFYPPEPIHPAPVGPAQATPPKPPTSEPISAAAGGNCSDELSAAPLPPLRISAIAAPLAPPANDIVAGVHYARWAAVGSAAARASPAVRCATAPPALMGSTSARLPPAGHGPNSTIPAAGRDGEAVVDQCPGTTATAEAGAKGPVEMHGFDVAAASKGDLVDGSAAAQLSASASAASAAIALSKWNTDPGEPGPTSEALPQDVTAGKRVTCAPQGGGRIGPDAEPELAVLAAGVAVIKPSEATAVEVTPPNGDDSGSLGDGSALQLKLEAGPTTVDEVPTKAGAESCVQGGAGVAELIETPSDTTVAGVYAAAEDVKISGRWHLTTNIHVAEAALTPHAASASASIAQGGASTAAAESCKDYFSESGDGGKDRCLGPCNKSHEASGGIARNQSSASEIGSGGSDAAAGSPTVLESISATATGIQAAMGGVSPASDGEKQVHRLEAKADASALDPRSHKTVPEAVATMQPSLQSFDHKIIGAATPAAPNPSEASQVGGLTNLPPDGTGALPLQAAGTATAITAQQHTVCADGISLVSGPPPSSPPPPKGNRSSLRVIDLTGDDDPPAASQADPADIAGAGSLRVGLRRVRAEGDSVDGEDAAGTPAKRAHFPCAAPAGAGDVSGPGGAGVRKEEVVADPAGGGLRLTALLPDEAQSQDAQGVMVCMLVHACVCCVRVNLRLPLTVFLPARLQAACTIVAPVCERMLKRFEHLASHAGAFPLDLRPRRVHDHPGLCPNSDLAAALYANREGIVVWPRKVQMMCRYGTIHAAVVVLAPEIGDFGKRR